MKVPRSFAHFNSHLHAHAGLLTPRHLPPADQSVVSEMGMRQVIAYTVSFYTNLIHSAEVLASTKYI